MPFKSKAPRLLDLIGDQDDDDIETAVSIVAKKIVNEVKYIETVKTRYDIRLTEETLTETVSYTLLSLLGQLSVELNKRNQAYMVGHMIIGCVRNFLIVLQIALVVLGRDSKARVTKLH